MRVSANMLWVLGVLSCFSALSAEESGVGTRGGGDIRAFEFTQLARGALALMKTSPVCGHPEVDFVKLEQVINSTRVVSVESTILDGKEVDVINDLKLGIIELNSKRIDAIRASQGVFMAFSLHEYFAMMQVDDSKYRISSKLLQCLTKDIRLAVNAYSSALEKLSLQSYTLEDLRLGQAIIQGDVNDVERALNAGASTNSLFYIIAPYNSRDKRISKQADMYLSALSLAAAHGNSQIVKLLVHRGALVNASDGTKRDGRFMITPLIYAVQFGSQRAVAALLDLGAAQVVFENPDPIHPEVPSQPFSALMVAAQQGDAEMARLLISRNADPCLKQGYGYQYSKEFMGFTGYTSARDFAEGEYWVNHHWVRNQNWKQTKAVIVEAQKNAGCYSSWDDFWD